VHAIYNTWSSEVYKYDDKSKHNCYHPLFHSAMCPNFLFLATQVDETVVTSTFVNFVFRDGRITTHADLRPHAARYSTNGASLAWRLRWGKDKHPRQYFLVVADWSDFGLLGEQSSPKWEIHCPGCRWTTVQNLTPLALSSAEKSVGPNHTNKQTNGKRYTHTLPIGMCG